MHSRADISLYFVLLVCVLPSTDALRDALFANPAVLGGVIGVAVGLGVCIPAALALWWYKPQLVAAYKRRYPQGLCPHRDDAHTSLETTQVMIGGKTDGSLSGAGHLGHNGDVIQSRVAAGLMMAGTGDPIAAAATAAITAAALSNPNATTPENYTERSSIVPHKILTPPKNYIPPMPPARGSDISGIHATRKWLPPRPVMVPIPLVNPFGYMPAFMPTTPPPSMMYPRPFSLPSSPAAQFAQPRSPASPATLSHPPVQAVQ